MKRTIWPVSNLKPINFFVCSSKKYNLWLNEMQSNRQVFPKFLASCLNASIHDSPERGAGFDGKPLEQDGPLFLHSDPQGDHIWVKVVSDSGLEIALNNRVEGVQNPPTHVTPIEFSFNLSQFGPSETLFFQREKVPSSQNFLSFKST